MGSEGSGCFVCGDPIAPHGYGYPGQPKDLPPEKRGVLFVAEITDFRVRNAVRRWLLVAIHRAARETDKARSLRQSREASICEARLTGLRNFALVLGPVEPETLLLREEWRVH